MSRSGTSPSSGTSGCGEGSRPRKGERRAPVDGSGLRERARRWPARRSHKHNCSAQLPSDSITAACNPDINGAGLWKEQRIFFLMSLAPCRSNILSATAGSSVTWVFLEPGPGCALPALPLRMLPSGARGRGKNTAELRAIAPFFSVFTSFFFPFYKAAWCLVMTALEPGTLCLTGGRRAGAGSSPST